MRAPMSRRATRRATGSVYGSCRPAIVAATLAEFVLEFPEFAGADPVLVQAKLSAAILEVDAGACGALSDEITYHIAARKLALSPLGNTSKLRKDDGSTVYDEELQRLRVVAVGSFTLT